MVLRLPVPIVVLLGLPLAAATLAVLSGWIRGGQLAGWLPAVGVAVLLVNLLAAGGIGFPGVAGTFWLLLAIGLAGKSGFFGRCQAQEVIQFAGREPRLPPYLAWAGLAGAVLMAAACYVTAYRPVLACREQIETAKHDPQGAVEHLRAAAAADRFSPEPWQRLAAVELGEWLSGSDRDALDRFEVAIAQANRLAPKSAPVWLAAGDAYSRAATVLDDRNHRLRHGILDKAVAAYQQAVALYPNMPNIEPGWPKPCWPRATGRPFAARPGSPCNWTRRLPTSTRSWPTMSATA